MNDSPHRNIQGLPKVGPTYSSIDEKQRILADEILKGRIRPELKTDINLFIKGLERKKIPSYKNSSTFKLITPLSSKGKQGYTSFWNHYNHSRIFIPFVLVMAIYYDLTSRLNQVYTSKVFLNHEYETCYMKLQTFPGHSTSKNSFMA